MQELLCDPATGFVVVTSPERAALNEAIVFAAELDRAGMHRSALIVNRMQPLDPAGADVPATAARLAPSLGSHLAQTVARTHADIQVLARRDHAALACLRQELNDRNPVCIADREANVHDVAALIDLHNELSPSRQSVILQALSPEVRSAILRLTAALLLHLLR